MRGSCVADSFVKVELVRVEMSAKSLRRYTNLAATIHLLSRRKITLLDPTNWDDKNDAFFLAEYKRQKKVNTVLALCFAESPETYHHWRVFSHGCDGVCIEFEKKSLTNAFSGDGRVTADFVSYKKLNDLNSLMSGASVDHLPFLKRYPFKDEHEFRVVFTDKRARDELKQYEIALEGIKRITLSPWMPKPFIEPVKDTLRNLAGQDSIEIYRSTLIENEKWKSFASHIGT